MIISEEWLREWIELDLDTDGLVDRLTMSGLEVDSLNRAGPELKDVVVGRIDRVEAHPNADKLWVCDVDVGTRARLRIVCGASNARTGLRVAVALPGAVLPGGTRIARTRIRDVESSGMICSAAELALSEDADGILELDADLEVGVGLEKALRFDDAVIDIEITPNRGDCLSIVGVARELAILTGTRLRKKDVPGLEATARERPRVALRAGESCPRFVGRQINGLATGVRTPAWMAERLRRCGVRPLSPVVDVTNYVMLELGQPMHAFDAGRLRGSLGPRFARKGETLALLDGSTVELNPDTLVIADDNAPVGLAGIMGGMESAISTSTTDIVFEAAHFLPRVIARRAREFGMQTDSSYRFERGVDPSLPPVASQYATYLITRIAGGRSGPPVDRRLSKFSPKRTSIPVRLDRANRLLGTAVPRRAAADVFERIGTRITEAPGGWWVTPPSHRFDLERECDLIEELARVQGYETIPATHPSMPATARVGSERDVPLADIRQVLVERGYREAITYSFVAAGIQETLAPASAPLALANPLTDKMNVMRASLWPGLLQAALSNMNRQHGRIRLLEVGRVFRTNGRGMQEISAIGGLAAGPVFPGQWGLEPRQVDFFDVKCDVEALLSLSGRNEGVAFEREEGTVLHPGQAATVRLEGRAVGRLGRLHPALQSKFDLDRPVFMFELELDAVRQRRLPAYRGVSRFPAIHRDLSLTVGSAQPVAGLVEAVREAGGAILADVQVFDVYQPPGETSSGKSVGIGLTLRDSCRTLKDQEVEAVIEKILDVLGQRFGAKLRT